MIDLNYRGVEYDTYEKLYLGIINCCTNKEIDKDEFTELVKELKPFLQEERKKNINEYWKNFNTKLNTPHDIPSINVFGEDYQNYVIPALIRNGAIPKNKIKDGHFYYGNWRAGNFGKFNKDQNGFEMWRSKFGHWYLDHANHFEDDDNMALFVPIREITEDQFNNREI